MDKQKIDKPIDLKNALNQPGGTSGQKPKPKAKKTGKKVLFTVIFAITVMLVFSSRVLISDQSSTSWFSKIPILSQLKHLAESADKKLKGEDRDRINILLLGMGGKNHDGSNLTDTIIVASLQPSTGKVAMVSVPRDMVVPIEDMGWQKINSVNAYAESDNPGSGGLAVSQAVSDVLLTPIDYYVRVDFAGFIDIIDKVGGINVDVENTLDDYNYPIMGREDAEPYDSRFEHLHIDTGEQTMDGALALKYARSRHAAGVEGSDFARARRQQKIIEAVKDKLLNFNLLLNPQLITDIIGDLQDHISTNLQVWEIVKLWSKFKDVTSGDITNKVLDNGPNGLLVDSISDQGAYILLPRSGDFAEIQYYVNNVFNQASPDETAPIIKESATVEIRNGTWVNGLASQVAVDLEKLGFKITKIGNSSRQNFQKSVIYDLTYGEKNQSLDILKRRTSANVSTGMPQWLIDDIASDNNVEKNPVQPDFVLILGQEADVTGSGEQNSAN